MIGTTNSFNNHVRWNVDEHTILLLTDDFNNKSNYPIELFIAASCQINSSIQRDGRNSIYIPNNSTSYIRIDTNLGIYGNNNWTIESWVYVPDFKVRALYSQRNSATSNNQYGVACYFGNTATNGPRFLVSTNTSSWNVRDSSSGSYSTAIWFHLAFVRNGNLFQVFKNGTLTESFSSTASLVNVDTRWWIGYYNNGTQYYFNGYIQDFRVSNIARYTINFTPPVRLV